jgi:hypothetical protein
MSVETPSSRVQRVNGKVIMSISGCWFVFPRMIRDSYGIVDETRLHISTAGHVYASFSVDHFDVTLPVSPIQAANKAHQRNVEGLADVEEVS